MIFDTLLGRLKQIGEVPEKACFGTVKDFLALLTKLVAVEFPINARRKFVVVGPETPGPDETDLIWFRYNKQGRWLGKFGYIGGQWRPLYDFPTGTRLLFEGTPESNEVPEGFTVTDTDINLGGEIYYAAKWVSY